MMIFDVFGRVSFFAKKKEMVHGEKKSRTTNLDFPSVLLNQGLTEANNNTREETSFAFFHKRGGKKRKKERGKERKRDS